jgi:hypothetical protein
MSSFLEIIYTIFLVILIIYIMYAIYEAYRMSRPIVTTPVIKKEKKKVNGMSDLNKDPAYSFFTYGNAGERTYFNDKSVKKLGKVNPNKTYKDKTCKIDKKIETDVKDLLTMTSLKGKILTYHRDNSINYDGKKIVGKGKKYTCFAGIESSLYMGVEGKKDMDVYKDGKFSTINLDFIPLSLLTYKDGLISKDANGIIYHISKDGKIINHFFLTDRNNIKVVPEKLVLDDKEKYLYALCKNIIVRIDNVTNIVRTYNLSAEDIVCVKDEVVLSRNNVLFIISPSFNEVKTVEMNYQLLPSLTYVNGRIFIIGSKNTENYLLEINVNNGYKIEKETVFDGQETPLISYSDNSLYTYAGQKLFQLSMTCNSI